MLSWRLQTSSEKAELQELNARLYEYVCRVRELERENLLLEEELRSRLSREDRWAEDQALYAEEARSLRQQLDELNWSTALAEGERDALRRELLELQREDEARLCAQEADALRNQALELEQLRARLEDELLRMREEYGMQAEERQRVIDSLEDEKDALTLAMADRLREYQELLQVKTGLSLEVATYRALLEGESNPEILIWTENIENVPRESRNTSYRYTDSVLQRKNEKNLFPRRKTPWAAVNHSSTLYSNGPGHLDSQTTTAVGNAARRGFLTSCYSSSATTSQQKPLEKTVSSQASLRPVIPTHGFLRNTDAQVKTFSHGPKAEGMGDTLTRRATESVITRESYRGHQGNVAAGAVNSTQSNERTVILGKKLETQATKEQERDRSGVVKLKPEEKMFDSKEKASEERNLRWEELTKLDARERESQHLRNEAKGKETLTGRSRKEREVPISLEVSRGSKSEVSTIHLQSSGRKDSANSREREVKTKETKFHLDGKDTAGSLQSDSTTETIAENIVTTILKQFTQSPGAEENVSSLPDTKVTYLDRKEFPGDRKTKTEIVVESKLTEDVDVSDEAGLDYLLSKDVKEVGLKGKSTETVIGEMINLGLKGREGRAKVVNVEIVEEPMSYVGGGKVEFSTPFQVEEVDDVSPSPKGFIEEEEGEGETHMAFSMHQRQRTNQPQVNVPHVEEVTEAGDSEGEQSYFVSTPDEYPGGHDREDDGSVYGQIHIEEESTIRYSWQDEIAQGTWRRKARGDTGEEKHMKVLEVPSASLGGAFGSAHVKEEASGELHAEPTIIEKEIKIPHEFHTSIKGVFSSEPRHQLVEVIGQLEETLPERMKEELSALTRQSQGEPGSVSVDVKKVQSSAGGSVTLMAEVNLSQTVDADQLDLEELSRDEAGEIEKAVESVVRESLTKRSSPVPRSPDREDGEEAPAGGFLFKRWATRELYSPSGEKDDTDRVFHSSDQRVTQGPVSATVEVTSPTGFVQSHVLEDVSQSVRHVKLGPTEMWRTEQVSYGGPTSPVVEMGVSDTRAIRSWTRDTGSEVEAHSVSHHGGWRVAHSRDEQSASTSSQASAGDAHQARGEKGTEQAGFDKTVQLQRMVDQRSVASDEKKVALLYLDNEEEEEGEGWF